MFAKHGFAGLAIACGYLLVLTVQQARNLAADESLTQPQSSQDRGLIPQDAGEKSILEVLKDMESNPALKMMNVDPAEGRLLRVLAESTNAQTIVEVGTSYGYSGLWFCLGLRKTGGKLITHEIDPVRSRHSGELVLAHNAVSHKDKMQPYLDAVSSRPELDTQILNLTGQGMAITLKKR